MRLLIVTGCLAVLSACGTEVVIEEKEIQRTGQNSDDSNKDDDTNKDDDNKDDGAAKLTFEDDIKPLLQTKGCLTGTGCHDAAGDNPDIGSFAVASTLSDDPKFTDGHNGKTWDQAEKDKIAKWVADGKL